MSHADDSSVDARVRAVSTEYLKKQTRLFLRFALIEGVILLLLVVGVYGFEIVEPEIGIWAILAVALAGGSLLSMLIVRHTQARTRAMAQARGDNPLF
nr:hypothetical protein [uncultured Microbacterium sp.]